jgi:DNA-binding transcriptional MerR regulator
MVFSRNGVATELGVAEPLLRYWERTGVLDAKAPRPVYVLRARLVRRLRKAGATMREVRRFLETVDPKGGK